MLGHLAVLHTEPMPDSERYTRIFRIVANRAGAELRRLNLERELRAKSEELDHAFGEIIGESPPMRRLVGEITEVARTDASVLSVCFRSMRRPCAPAAGTSTSLRLSSPADSVNDTEDPRRP